MLKWTKTGIKMGQLQTGEHILVCVFRAIKKHLKAITMPEVG